MDLIMNIKICIIFFIIIIEKRLKKNFNDFPNISIIIPIFNNAKYLPFCLNSIIHQSLKNIEILCINDGSTDESLNIVKEFQKIDNRIIIINQNNKGSAMARNKGIKKSKGEYIAFIDSDDMYPNNYTLELLYNKSIQNSALICGGCLNRIRLINGSYNISEGGDNFQFYKEETIPYFNFQFDFGFLRFIFQTKFLKENQIYFPNYLRYQDPPFLIKAMGKAKKFYQLNYTTYLYRKSHKKILWTSKKLIDQYKGFNECLTLSEKLKLDKLYCTVVQRLNLELFLIPTKEYINNTNLKTKILNILNKINFQKLKKENCTFKLNNIYKQFLENDSYLEWFS